MTRKEMQKGVLESMVTARDGRIAELESKLLDAKRLNALQGDKILELLPQLQAITETLDDAGLLYVGEEFCGCRFCD